MIVDEVGASMNYVCEHCGVMLQIENLVCGKSFKCPKCGIEFTVNEDLAPREFIEPCMFGGFVVVRETWLDRLPWWVKFLLVIGTFFCCLRFTVPVLDLIGRLFFGFP